MGPQGPPGPTGPQGPPGDTTALQAQISDLQGQINALKAQLANVLALNSFVTVDPNPENGVAGPHITFTGANIHIVDGLNRTNSANGLGNLIIGYDESPGNLASGDRGGSHNLIIGPLHRFTQAAYGGLVAGFGNTISGNYAGVSGGSQNVANGFGSSVTGGYQNTAGGAHASVTGGDSNTASNDSASVTGGYQNTAGGAYASVTGGSNNTASGNFTVVLGTQNVTDNNTNAVAPVVAP